MNPLLRNTAPLLALSLLAAFPVGATLPAGAAAPLRAQAVDQLPGIDALIGKPVRLGENYPFQFTLESAEYTVERVDNTDFIRPLAGDQKVLKLRFSVQNAMPREQRLRASTLNLTAVDATGVNHEGQKLLRRVEDPVGALDLSLKPAQKVTCVASVRVPADAVVPKLIIQRTADPKAKVLRYDLRGKVKPLTAPYADPADATGQTARTSVPAETGTFYPMGNWDLRLDALGEATPDDLGLRAARKGYGYFAATVTLRNAMARPLAVSANRMTQASFVTDAAGERFAAQAQRHGSRPESYPTAPVAPGQTVTLRVVFALPEGTAPKEVHLAEYLRVPSRAYVFPAGGSAAHPRAVQSYSCLRPRSLFPGPLSRRSGILSLAGRLFTGRVSSHGEGQREVRADQQVHAER